MVRIDVRPLVLIAIAAASACKGVAPQPSPSPQGTELKTEEEKTAYAVGVLLARNLTPLGLTPAEVEIVKQGLADQAAGKPPRVPIETYGPKVQELAQKRAVARAADEKGKAKQFQDTAAQEPGAVKTPSGLVFRTLTPGTGKSPAATDVVKVHYRGTLTDGTEFDSSLKRGEPVEFHLNQVIPCWTEGVQRMKTGEKAKLVCPSDIAYGDQGRPPVIPGGATLVFEVELLAVK
jgi:FKBP-type peptidyl-prolyl cis-trans isomerase FkpA